MPNICTSFPQLRGGNAAGVNEPQSAASFAHASATSPQHAMFGMGELQTPTLNNRRKMTDDENNLNPFSPAFQGGAQTQSSPHQEESKTLNAFNNI